MGINTGLTMEQVWIVVSENSFGWFRCGACNDEKYTLPRVFSSQAKALDFRQQLCAAHASCGNVPEIITLHHAQSGDVGKATVVHSEERGGVKPVLTFYATPRVHNPESGAKLH